MFKQSLKSQKRTIFFAVGVLFYCIAEVDTIVKVPAVWLTLQPHLTLPLSQFALTTDRYLPAFMLAFVPAIFFTFLSFAYIKTNPLPKTLLYLVATLAVFLAVPDLTWNTGDVYYETLKFYMGQVSLVCEFITVMFFRVSM